MLFLQLLLVALQQPSLDSHTRLLLLNTILPLLIMRFNYELLNTENHASTTTSSTYAFDNRDALDNTTTTTIIAIKVLVIKVWSIIYTLIDSQEKKALFLQTIIPPLCDNLQRFVLSVLILYKLHIYN